MQHFLLFYWIIILQPAAIMLQEFITFSNVDVILNILIQDFGFFVIYSTFNTIERSSQWALWCRNLHTSLFLGKPQNQSFNFLKKDTSIENIFTVSIWMTFNNHFLVTTNSNVCQYDNRIYGMNQTIITRNCKEMCGCSSINVKVKSSYVKVKKIPHVTQIAKISKNFSHLLMEPPVHIH